MMAAEPMMMGSPVGSPVGGGLSAPHGTFLPPYLMGEPAPMASPSNSRLWSSPSSPVKQTGPSRNTSFITSPPQTPSAFANTSRFESRGRDMLGSRQKDKAGAPPVQGLLEHITSPVGPTPDRKHTDFLNQSKSFSTSFMAGSTTPGAYQSMTEYQNQSIFSPGNQSTHMYSQPKKTPPSPAQIDPFYTQGESIQPGDQLDDTWITVFGFPAAVTSFILQQFSQYGNILKHVVATDGNWLHIRYQSRLQAKKALSKNGKVFGGSIMVGVAPCIDKGVMEANSGQTSTGILSTPTQALSPATERSAPIRPLTAAYRAASSDHEVLHKTNTPQKSSNMVSKAMEYMFGW